jgi:hypothetical protein
MGYLPVYHASWSGSAVEAGKLMAPLNDLRGNLMAGKGTAATLLVDVKNQIDAQLRSIYETYKSSPLANDALCS